MNITLPHHFDQLVKSPVESGQYQSASDVVMDALRLLEKEQANELEYFRGEIQKGIDSGVSGTWNKDEFLRKAWERFS